MRGTNEVNLIGVLARDPELQYTPGGVAKYEATVAGEDEVLLGDGTSKTMPWYYRVTLLGKGAEWMAEGGLHGGDPVLVEGLLAYSTWQTEDGAKRSAVKVRASRIEGLAMEVDTKQDAGGGVRMAGGQNTVRPIGNLARDPELRYTPAGDAVLAVGLAVNETYTQNGQAQKKVHWLDATLWRELAEAYKGLHKGDPVQIAGRLVTEQWTDKDGNKRHSTKVETAMLLPLQRPPVTDAPRNTREGVAASASNARREAPRNTSRAPARSAAADIPQGTDDFPPPLEDLPF